MTRAEMESKKNLEFLRSYTFDEAISKTGYGKFHYKIVAVCSLSILCVGFQNGLTSYVFSAALCDLNITSQELGLLNVAFMLGGTISAFIWGVTADLMGRRKVLVVTTILDFLVTLGCSLMQSFCGVMICRFLNGFLIGCPGCISFTYLAEFHSPKLRAKSVCYSGIAFIAAWVLLPVLAFQVLPMKIDFNVFNVTYTSWRFFLLIIAIPELLAGLFLLILPESPKFLHDKSYDDVALDILTDIYSQNTNNEKKDFCVKALESNVIAQEDLELLKCPNKKIKMIRDMSIQMKKLLSSEFRLKTFLLSFIMLTNMFGYFGFGVWLPEFFIRFEEHYKSHPNESISLSELTFSDSSNSTMNCSFTFDTNIFRNTLIVAGSALICNALAGWLTGKVSMKGLSFATLFVGGFTSLSMYWIQSSLGILVVSSIFQASMATANMVIGSIAVEEFPTSINAMGLSITVTTGRIGAIGSNLVFSLLLGKHTAVIIFLVSILLFLGAVLCILLPSSNNSKQENKSVEASKVSGHISVIFKHENCGT